MNNDIIIGKEDEVFPLTIVQRYHMRKEIRNTIDFKNRNQAWGASKLGYWQELGYCMDTIREYRPQSLEEWAKVYFTHCKSWEAIQSVGRRWAAIAGISETQGIAEALIHSLDETWEGYEGELAAEILLKKQAALNDCTVREATAKEDLEYAIDFVVEDREQKPVFAVQVKPQTFFFSTRIAKDRRQYLWQNRQFTQATGRDVYYINADIAKLGKLEYIPISDLNIG